jgi:hypothetical protein
MKTRNDAKRPDAAALKAEYLKCFGVRTNNTSVLRQTVKGLMDRGVSRKTLVVWAVQAGYTKGYVSSLLSRILCSIGLRANRIGAGRKPSLDALELLAHARSRYGERFLNVLRAAWRAGRTQAANEDSKLRIVAPQIQEAGKNCGATILARGRSGVRNGSSRPQTAFVNYLNPTIRLKTKTHAN